MPRPGGPGNLVVGLGLCRPYLLTGRFAGADWPSLVSVIFVWSQVVLGFKFFFLRGERSFYSILKELQSRGKRSSIHGGPTCIHTAVVHSIRL
jgi:hypothetical protein